MKTIRIPQYIFTFGLIFFLLGSFSPSGLGGGDKEGKKGGKKELGEDAPIRFDGFYYKRGIMRPSQQQAQGFTYFRFYPDKTVIMTTSASEPERVARRFNRSYAQADSKFKLYEDNGNPAIRFSIKHFGVSQSYEGKAGKDSLNLKLYAGESEFEYDDIYLFYQVDDLKD